MKQKTLKTKQPIDDSSELSLAERWVQKLAPYGSQIALGIAVCFLAFIAVTFLVKSSYDRRELQWRQLNNSITEVGINGNTNSLKQVAEDFPNGKAGKWALQLAGDYDLRTGISQLSYDREGGLKLIAKARDSLQEVYDAPASEKSSMLQRRSIFSLAYATESLGEFEAAKSLYQELSDNAPGTPFAEPARRGIERTSNPQYAEMFAMFEEYIDPLSGDAPGPSMPRKPDISFPDLDAAETPETVGGGDFGSEPASDENATEEGASDSGDEDSGDEDSGDEDSADSDSDK